MRLSDAKHLGYDRAALPADKRIVVSVEVNARLFARAYWWERPDAPLSASEESMIEEAAAVRLLRTGRFCNVIVAEKHR